MAQYNALPLYSTNGEHQLITNHRTRSCDFARKKVKSYCRLNIAKKENQHRFERDSSPSLFILGIIVKIALKAFYISILRFALIECLALSKLTSISCLSYR